MSAKALKPSSTTKEPSATLRDIALEVAAVTGFSSADTYRALAEFVHSTTRHLKAGEKVHIAEFGIFEINFRREREGRNPQTKRPLVIKSSKTIRFRPSKMLKLHLDA